MCIVFYLGCLRSLKMSSKTFEKQISSQESTMINTLYFPFLSIEFRNSKLKRWTNSRLPIFEQHRKIDMSADKKIELSKKWLKCCLNSWRAQGLPCCIIKKSQTNSWLVTIFSEVNSLEASKHFPEMTKIGRKRQEEIWNLFVPNKTRRLCSVFFPKTRLPWTFLWWLTVFFVSWIFQWKSLQKHN